MARTMKSHPEPRMQELREKRARLNVDREQVAAGVRDARKGLGQVPARERQALLAVELQRDGEPVEAVAKEAERWQRQIAAGEQRIGALNDADQVLARDQLAVVDENPAHYEERATVASTAAEAAVEQAMQAISDAQEAWRVAEVGWQVVRASTMRRGGVEGPHVPSPDFGQVTFRLGQITEAPPWPGGQRPDDDA